MVPLAFFVARRGEKVNFEKQKSAPVYEALERFRKRRVVPFDVPGHKRGEEIRSL